MLQGGGGVDGAISRAGGMALRNDRESLPQVSPGVRCPTGRAVINGPGNYGELNAPYVIHAVGPKYSALDSEVVSRGKDELLTSAYATSLVCGGREKLEAIAFSLLSAGVFRGAKTLEQVLAIGMLAICSFEGYKELKNVFVCAFTDEEAYALVSVAKKIGLEQSE